MLQTQQAGRFPLSLLTVQLNTATARIKPGTTVQYQDNLLNIAAAKAAENKDRNVQKPFYFSVTCQRVCVGGCVREHEELYDQERIENTTPTNAATLAASHYYLEDSLSECCLQSVQQIKGKLKL